MVKYRLTRKGKLVAVIMCSFIVLSVTLGVSLSKDKTMRLDYSSLNADSNPSLNNPQLKEPVLPQEEKTEISAELMEKLKMAVFFEANATSISSKYNEDLGMFAEAAMQYPDTQIQIEGNCATLFDNSQSKVQKSANYNISLLRAQSIANYMKDKGINPDRLIVISNGSDKPLKDNATPEGRKYNRRVDVFFVNK